MKNIFAQILILLVATGALALFYLSYRPGDFVQPFVSIGFILIGPWLLISLMPVLFILEDKELKKEIVMHQCLLGLIVVILLSGLAVYYDFHTDILAHVNQLLLKGVSVCQDSIEAIIEFSRKSYDFVKNFAAENIAPLFS